LTPRVKEDNNNKKVLISQAP